MEKAFENLEVWFVTGAQLLYGGDAVVQVDGHSQQMVDGMNESGLLPVKLVYKGTANSSAEVVDVMSRAEAEPRCIGVITWMHTFSPAKMWIHGMQRLRKPLLHLHTQFNEEIPWNTMDMDFMNLNQSAHGDREFGHILARMRKGHKTVVGYWKDKKTLKHIARVECDLNVFALARARKGFLGAANILRSSGKLQGLGCNVHIEADRRRRLPQQRYAFYRSNKAVDVDNSAHLVRIGQKLLVVGEVSLDATVHKHRVAVGDHDLVLGQSERYRLVRFRQRSDFLQERSQDDRLEVICLGVGKIGFSHRKAVGVGSDHAK